MGLFSSKSKSFSTSTTNYNDTSRNINIDMSTGDLSDAGGKNIIAGGDIKIDGITEDLAGQIFGVIQDAYSGATDWVTNALNVQSQNNDKAVAALQNAYNSEQATISSFKSYALYALFGWVAWVYLVRKR